MGKQVEFGHFEDGRRAYVIDTPVTPRPWINYLGNRRLRAFVSHNGGGLLWHREPYCGRLTRYHYLAPPGDQPGFYVYVRDRRTGQVWNPHFAPTCTPLEQFSCCHQPGRTTFAAVKDGVRVEVAYGIPPAAEVMLWQVTVTNLSAAVVAVQLASYLEFGLLEFMREAIGWCYLKNHLGFHFDRALGAIRYDYHVFEAPSTPAMLFGASVPVSAFDCSREAFVGRTGSLQVPEALRPGRELSHSELPLGGHGCGALAVDLELSPGQSSAFSYCFALADSWPAAAALLESHRSPAAVAAALGDIDRFWQRRLEVLQVDTGEAPVDRFLNTWNPCNAMTALELARTISTDHMGTDGLRYRDTAQDAMAVATLDPEYAADRLRLLLAQQRRDGGGCFAFYPDTNRPTSDRPHRSDNTVWPVYTVDALLAETGSADFLFETIPYREGGQASVYDHLLLGLRHIYQRRGPHGLPTLFDADWNDGLALFQDEQAESVMLGQQLVYACRRFADLARRFGTAADADWCERVAAELAAICNSAAVWDGRWYRRLLLSNGKTVGSAANRQGSIYLNSQSWAVIAGIAESDGRGRMAMDAAAEWLDSDCGLRICAPPYRGFPEPEDPPLGSNPGIGENGSIFCHANTWAIIAECLLGNPERAWKYYRQLLPERVAARVGAEHYQREPYAYVSSIVGPVSDRFGEGGISWLTGTASWMYVAATQYLLGLRPTFDGLLVAPCLPATIRQLRVVRRFRGCRITIDIDHAGRACPVLQGEGVEIRGQLLIPTGRATAQVVCHC